LEELVEEILKFIARLVLIAARFVVAVVWTAGELYCGKMVWYIGWPITRVLSFNNFPKEEIHEN
jgi:hypothetical protein